MGTWKLYARSAAMLRVAEVEDFSKLDAIPRFNDVGSWTLEMPLGASGASDFLQDGSGLVVALDGAVQLSGPVLRRERDWDENGSILKLAGVDDSVWLSRRLAHPQPATAAPPYSSSAYDVRTGTCSTILLQYADVNAGPSALGARQVAGLSLAADPALGSSVTGRARWQNLLTLLQELALAGGGLGFTIEQSGAGIQFSVYQPTDRTASVIFSPGLANLAAYSWSEEAAKANYVYVGASGETTTRILQEGQDSDSIARWGRVETFVDRRDTSDATEINQAITDELEQSAGPTGLTITPIDLPQMAYGTDYGLGDQVTAMLDGVAVQDVVREVRITLDQDGATVVPVIGTPGPKDLLRLFDRLRRAETRLALLERR